MELYTQYCGLWGRPHPVGYIVCVTLVDSITENKINSLIACNEVNLNSYSLHWIAVAAMWKLASLIKTLIHRNEWTISHTGGASLLAGENIGQNVSEARQEVGSRQSKSRLRSTTSLTYSSRVKWHFSGRQLFSSGLQSFQIRLSPLMNSDLIFKYMHTQNKNGISRGFVSDLGWSLSKFWSCKYRIFFSNER